MKRLIARLLHYVEWHHEGLFAHRLLVLLLMKSRWGQDILLDAEYMIPVEEIR